MNKKILIGVVFLIIIGITVGYASFNAVTSIEDISAFVKIKKDIRVTGVSVSDDGYTNGAISNYAEYDVESISSSIQLPNSNSSITFKIEITNIESAIMGIYNISGIPENLDYSISNYKLKDKICDENNNCNLGITKDIYITISYKDGNYDLNNIDFIIDLKFEFRQIHSISYSGIDDFSTYPTHVIDGDDVSFLFENRIPSLVTVTGSNNYLYDSSRLTINDVTEDIIINCLFIGDVDFGIIGDGDVINIATDKISAENPITIDSLLEMEFGGINLTKKVITQIDVVVTYTTNTGSVQTFNCNLTVGEQKYTQLLTALGKQNNATATASFNNLSIATSEEFVITNTAQNLTNKDITFTDLSITVFLS